MVKAANSLGGGVRGSPRAFEISAVGLLKKGDVLVDDGRPTEAIAVFDDLIGRFGTITERPIRRLVAIALRKKGDVLIDLRRHTEAITAYDALIDCFGTETWGPISEQVAIALHRKGDILIDKSEAIAAFDDLIGRFNTSFLAPIRDQVAIAFLKKGDVLIDLRRHTEALATYDALIDCFVSAPVSEVTYNAHGHGFEIRGIPTRKQVVIAFLKKGDVLIELRRPAEAVAAYDDLIGRFGPETATPVRELVAIALRKKGDILVDPLARRTEAIAAYDDLIGRFATATEKSIRDQVAMARFSRIGVYSATKDPATHYHITNLEVYMGDVFKHISNSTIVSRSEVERAFNRLQDSGQVESAKLLVDIGKHVSDANNVAAGAVYGQMTEELSKPTHDRRALKSYWDGLVAILPSLAQLSAEVIKAFAL